jgi:nitrogen fixation protein NifB
VIKEPRIKVVGIAGPGDPLDNEATFTTLEMVKKEFPGLLLCLSTNGLLLPEKLDALLEVGLDSLTVTVNTLNENTGAGIYEYIIHKDMLIRGPEASAILRDNQIEGIRRAVNSGIRVKANSVLIRGINENEMVPLSQTLCSLGVTVMNIMPLIPMAKFSHLSPVPAELHQAIRQECSLYIDQISHCRQCRADAVGLLTKELQLESCR